MENANIIESTLKIVSMYQANQSIINDNFLLWYD